MTNDTAKRKNVTIAAFFLLLACMTILFSSCTPHGSSLWEEEEAYGAEKKEVEAVPLGSWQDIVLENAVDGSSVDAKVRITGVDSNKASVKQKIEDYNRRAQGSKIEPLSESVYVYQVAAYELSLPDGVNPADVTLPIFTVCSSYGEDFIEDGEIMLGGTSKATEITPPSDENTFYEDGNYHGEILFTMIEGFGDYRLKEKSFNGENHFYMPKAGTITVK